MLGPHNEVTELLCGGNIKKDGNLKASELLFWWFVKLLITGDSCHLEFES